MPANTYIASILAVSVCGPKPVLVEPDPKLYNVAAEGLRKAITEATKVILSAHLYGRACEMNEIASLAKETGILILEGLRPSPRRPSRLATGRIAGACGGL